VNAESDPERASCSGGCFALSCRGWSCFLRSISNAKPWGSPKKKAHRSLDDDDGLYDGLDDEPSQDPQEDQTKLRPYAIRDALIATSERHFVALPTLIPSGASRACSRARPRSSAQS